MRSVTTQQIEAALSEVRVVATAPEALDRFVAYLELLLRWNTRLNLTAIREPGQIVQRHFAESAFAADQLPGGIESLLDFGSGAGFPGIPIAICRPEIRVTLAESQGKKASFLREAVRVLGISADVYAGRVETMPENRRFHAVSMRAVEKMERAIPEASRRAERYLVLLTTERSAPDYQKLTPELQWIEPFHLPNSEQVRLAIGEKS